MLMGYSSLDTVAITGPVAPPEKKRKKNKTYSAGRVIESTYIPMIPLTVINITLALTSTDFLPNRLANQPDIGLPKIKAKAKVDNTPPAEVLVRPYICIR